MAKKSSSRTTAKGKKTARRAGKTTSKKVVKKLTKKASRKPAGAAARKASKKTVAPGEKPAKRLKKSPLTKREQKRFREMLLEKRRSLVGDMTGMEAEALRTNGNGGDLSLMPDHPANIASDNYEQEFTLGLLESERILLSKIDAALERVEKGTYGICLGTGRPIGKARLEARPWTRYCIEYARMIEKGLVGPDENGER